MQSVELRGFETVQLVVVAVLFSVHLLVCKLKRSAAAMCVVSPVSCCVRACCVCACVCVQFWRINLLLVIGGQGGNQLASQLAEGCQQRGIPCCIAGVSEWTDGGPVFAGLTGVASVCLLGGRELGSQPALWCSSLPYVQGNSNKCSEKIT